MVSNIDEYISLKLGDDIEFKNALYAKYSLLKILDFNALPPKLIKDIDKQIAERKQELEHLIIKYFNEHKKSTSGMQEVEYKGDVSIASYDGKRIVTNKVMISVKGNLLHGVSYS